MTPEISQALATFIGAGTTVLLMWAASMWGPNSRRQKRKHHDEEDHDHQYHEHDE